MGQFTCNGILTIGNIECAEIPVPGQAQTQAVDLLDRASFDERCQGTRRTGAAETSPSFMLVGR